MNAPLPTFDMMTGQPVVAHSVSATAAAMLANDSDVVHVQLLDRMIVVPREIVNVSPVLYYHTQPGCRLLACCTDRVHSIAKWDGSVQGPTLRNKITSPDGQAPIDQQGQAYLLFVDWKNFHPLLEYMCGNPVQLPRLVASASCKPPVS